MKPALFASALLSSGVMAALSPAYGADGDILVTGRPLPVSMGDAAYDPVQIDRGRILATASGRIEDVLRDVAGLTDLARRAPIGVVREPLARLRRGAVRRRRGP